MEGKPDLGQVATARAIRPVTASDTTDLSGLAGKGLLIGGAGNLYVQCVGDAGIQGPIAVVAGQWLPLNIKHVGASTTATGIWALA